MSTIVTRYGKGSPLTWLEVDNNFTNLNTDKIQSGDTVAALTITSATINGGTITGITDLAVADGGTGLSSLTAGYIPYGAGTSAFGSSANLFWDSANNRLGIGTTSPQGTLHVTSNYGSQPVPFGSEPQVVVGGAQGGAGTQGYLGSLWFASSDGGSDFGEAAGIVGNALGDFSPTSRAGHLEFYTTASGSITPTERMRIDSSGNVGLGTSSPGARLDVNGSATVSSQVNVSAIIGPHVTSDLLLGSVNGNTPFVASQGAYPLTFNTNATERMRIDSSGNVGIGTTSASGTTLTVKGTTVNTNTGAVSFFKYLGTAASPTESIDWPTPVLSLRGFGDFTKESMLSFGYPNDANYQTGDGVWNFRLDGIGSATSSSSSTNLNLLGPGALVLGAGSAERMRIDSSGNVGIGGTPAYKLDVVSTAFIGSRLSASTGTNGVSQVYSNTGGAFSVGVDSSTGGNFGAAYGAFLWHAGAYPISFGTSNAERMRITSGGDLLVATTSTPATLTSTSTITGIGFNSTGYGAFTRDQGSGLYVNRLTNDGNLVEFIQAGALEGTISVSGTTVSYNGGHLSRWSQFYNETGQPNVYRGTVLESVDAMCEWEKDGKPLPNEQATKTIVSTTVASKAVAGVFDRYDEDDKNNPYDFYVAQSGDFIIRIAQGVTVQNGDLLESAGDGTAKPQADDICRSSTVAKVTSNYVSATYEDGSYCVPCILMIG